MPAHGYLQILPLCYDHYENWFRELTALPLPQANSRFAGPSWLRRFHEYIDQWRWPLGADVRGFVRNQTVTLLVVSERQTCSVVFL